MGPPGHVDTVQCPRAAAYAIRRCAVPCPPPGAAPRVHSPGATDVDLTRDVWTASPWRASWPSCTAIAGVGRRRRGPLARHRARPTCSPSTDWAASPLDRRGDVAVYERTRWVERARHAAAASCGGSTSRRRTTTRLTFLDVTTRATPPSTPRATGSTSWPTDDRPATRQLLPPARRRGRPRAAHAGRGRHRRLRPAEPGAPGRVVPDPRGGAASTTAWTALRSAHPGRGARRAGSRTVSTLHRLDLDTWRVEEAWAPDAYVLDFEVSVSELRVAAITAPDDDPRHPRGLERGPGLRPGAPAPHTHARRHPVARGGPQPLRLAARPGLGHR